MARTEPVVDPEAELEEGRMPFFDHLRELRDRLRNAAIFFIIGTAMAYTDADDTYDWLRVPRADAWAQHADTLGPQPTVSVGSIVEPFWVYLSVALWSGIFVASPFIFHQLWKF